jgi:hypothetical protein
MPSLTHKTSKSTVPHGILNRAVAYFRERRTTWVFVCISLTMGGIFNAIASTKTSGTSASAFDSNYFTNCSGLIFSFSSFILLLATLGSKPNSRTILCCGFITAIASISCVVIYPYSSCVSVWAAFVSQFFQLISTMLLIED